MKTRSGRGALVGVATLLYSTASWAADPMPESGPRPDWVQDVLIPGADPARKEEPAQFLMLAAQTKFSETSLDNYVEYAIVPQTVAGLQGAGTVILPWNTAQSELKIHTVEIRRGNQIIDLLKDAEFTVLRRENNLENAKLDGVRTVVLPARGLQLNDVVHVAATYKVKADSVGTHLDHLMQWKAPTKIGLFQSRVLIDPGLDVKWRTGALVEKPTITKTPAGTVYLFEKRNAEPPNFPHAMKPVDKLTDIQFTRIQNWSDIASSFKPLFDSARKIKADSELAKEADRIVAENSDPIGRMMSALRLSQEKVRYVALLLGDGAYVPTPAEENWDRKFGDCKGKTAMLLALLDRAGIAAAPMLVKSEEGELLNQRLPSLDAFDHVIVRATIAGKHYYLDPTDYGQRAVSEVAGSTLGWGLPLADGASLEALPQTPPEKPMLETSLTWDATAGIVGKVPFAATVTLRSSAARMARAKRATAEDKAKLEEFLKNYLPGVSNDDLEIADWTEADPSGEFVINFKGKASLSWDEYEGKKGLRFSFSNSAIQWEPNFDRDEGQFKESDVLIGELFWQREKETILLPKGAKGFSIDASTIAETVAGTRFDRQVTMNGDKVTSIGEFRHLQRSIPAAEARQSVERLEKIHGDYAYLVAPRGFRPPKEKSED